jgi:hypothetical protein
VPDSDRWHLLAQIVSGFPKVVAKWQGGKVDDFLSIDQYYSWLGIANKARNAHYFG